MVGIKRVASFALQEDGKAKLGPMLHLISGKIEQLKSLDD